MLEITRDNAAEYLRERGIAGARVSELAGGVSNTVLLVEIERERFVLKQSLGRLRVEQEWLSERDRIRREAGALRRLAPVLPAGAVPEVLWEDSENYLFAMSAAPPGATPWKALLLNGELSGEVAAETGRLLGGMIRLSWQNAEFAAAYGDQTVFDQLRLDPYYRTTASAHPEYLGYFEHLIASCGTRRVSLVHGDWSPKNLLISGNRVMAIDFEVIHYGDPSFDAGFLLNHLLLKSFHRPELRKDYWLLARKFWAALIGAIPATDWFQRSTMLHLGGLLLARVDGKSPVEYLGDADRKRVRSFAGSLIETPASDLEEVWRRAEE